MNKKRLRNAFMIALPVVLGAVIAAITKDGVNFYKENVVKPPLTPPAIVFPIVWTILYANLGISSVLVLNSAQNVYIDQKQSDSALFVYGLQLFFNYMWPILFFNLRLYMVSAIWLLVLIGCVFVMVIKFFSIRPLAAYLQIPYILWLCFAEYLNFGVYLLN